MSADELKRIIFVILAASIAISSAQEEGDAGGTVAPNNGTDAGEEDSTEPQGWRPVSTETEWGLAGLANMAQGIAYGLSPPEFPLDPIIDVFAKSGGSLETALQSIKINDLVDQILKSEGGLLGVTIVFFLVGFGLSIFGIIFCLCRRFRKHRAVHPEGEKPNELNDRTGIIMGVVLLILSIIVLIAACFTIASAFQVSQSLMRFENTAHDIMDDVDDFQDDIFEDVRQLFNVSSFSRTIKDNMNDIIDLVFSTFHTGLNGIMVPMSNTVSQFSTIFTSDRLPEIVSNSPSLQGVFDQLVEAIFQTVADLIEDVKQLCIQHTGNFLGICNLVPSPGTFLDGLSFIKEIDLTELSTSFSGIGSLISEMTTAMLSTGGNVLNEVHQTLHRPSGALHGMVDTVLVSLQPMVSSITGDVVAQVETMVRVNTSQYSGMIGGFGDMAKSYGSLIYGVFAVFATLALVLSILCTLGLVLGTARYTKTRLLSVRIRTGASRWSGRLMVGSTRLAVGVAVLFWVPTAILFMVGANLTLMCNSMVDLSLIDKTVDNPSMWGGKTFLNSMVESFISLGDSPHNLTVRHFMEQCQMDHSLYEAVYTSGFLEDLAIIDFDASPDEFLKPIEDFLIHGSTEAVTALKPLDLLEMLRPILSLITIPEFPREIFENTAQSLRDIVNAIPLQDILDLLNGFKSNPLLVFVRNVIDDILNILTPLGTFLTSVGDLLGAIVNQIPFFEGIYNQFRDYLTNVIDGASTGFDELTDVLSGANKAAATVVGPFITTFISIAEELIAVPINKIKLDFAKCGIMADTYEAVVSDMCGQLTSGIHALWLSTAIISVCCPAIVMLSFSLTKYVRRANPAAGKEENNRPVGVKPLAPSPNDGKDGQPGPQKKRRPWHVFTVSGKNVVHPT